VETNPLFGDKRIVQREVQTYNISPHRALQIGTRILAPASVEQNPDMEGVFIRRHARENSEIIGKQVRGGLFDYERGDILHVHVNFVDERKLIRVVERKRRKQFNFIAQFVEYVHGNARCFVLCKRVPVKDKEQVLPIYCTRFICHDLRELPEKYRKLMD
jgi:hypothetical protein